MKRTIWALTVIGIVALAGCKNSQLLSHAAETLPPDPAPQASDLTAEQLLAKYLAARGGEEKLAEIQSVTMAGKWETKQISSSPITLTVAPGRYLRRTEPGSGIVMIKAVDGESTWEVTPQTGITKPMPMVDKEAVRFRRLADPLGPLVNSQAKGNKIEVAGKMPWNNSQVYKLKVTFRDGGVNYIYLDAQTFLPVRLLDTMYVSQLEESIDLEFTYGDYRDVGGVKWPFHEEANAPEVNFKHVLTWERVEVNQPVNESAFKAASFEAPKS